MKKVIQKVMGTGFLFILLALFSFSVPGGGDTFRVYFNDRLVLEQFVHLNKSVQDLELKTQSENDLIGVNYSHCGQVGKNRYLTVRDEDNNPLHVWRFPEAAAGSHAMTLSVKEVKSFLKDVGEKFIISYSSKEIPNGITIAKIRLD